MTSELSPGPSYKGIAAFVRTFPYVHQGVGLLGNAFFVVGSLLFLMKEEQVGLYFFLVGSIGMFIGSLGEIVRAQGRRTLIKHDIDPQHPRQRWSDSG